MKNINILRTTNSLPFVFILSVFTILSQPLRVEAQVYTGDLTLSTQAQVNAFAYSEVTGNLTVSGADITNLDGLAGLNTVEGRLHIRNNPALTSINGLTTLLSIGNWLDISNNPSLTNIDGLSGLTSADNVNIGPNDALLNIDGLSSLTSLGQIGFDSNNALTNLDGLAGLTTIGELAIWNNDALTNLDGLSGLTSVGYLWFGNNDALPNLDALTAITSIGLLEIFDNPSLTNIDGLSALSSVQDMYITNNDMLTNLDGLSALSLARNLWINDNDMLTNLDGLSALTSVGNRVRIYNNPVLNSFCGLYPLINGGFTGMYIVTGNATNPTIADILAAGSCSDFTLINALTDKNIGYLYDGDILDLATLPTNQLAIRANLEGPDVASVRFGFQNVANFRIENFAPY
ncbi:MAG: hypothetical protein KDD63_14770, partial [Bacteroidetes bacterium]|nr:hypothetical protein [Bacteroidota bacterium]